MILNYFIKTELIATSFIDTDNKTHRVSFRYSYPSDCEKDATQKDAILEQVADVLADYCSDNQVKSQEILDIEMFEVQTSFKEFLTGINYAIVDTLESFVSSFRI
jgi:hypothetical protein